MHARLTNPDSIERVRQVFLEQVVLVSFAAQASHIPILLVPDTVPHYFGFAKSYTGEDAGSHHLVGVVEFGRGLYPLRVHGNLDWSYVHEKLRMGTIADARNITAFLNALGHPMGVRHYLEHIPIEYDHVNHEALVNGGSLYVRP